MSRLALFLCFLAGAAAFQTLSRISEGTNPPKTFVEVTEKIDLTQTVKMHVGLKRPGAKKMEEILLDRSHPESPRYAEWLSKDEVAALSKPQDQHIQTVTKWLNSYGISDIQMATNKDYFHFTTTRANVETMLNAKFRTYLHKPTQKVHYKITDPLRVPSEVAEAVDVVVGASGWPVEQGNFVQAKPAPNQITIDPQVLITRYNVSTSQATASSNLHAVAEFQGQYIVPSDLCTFYSDYMLNGSCKFTIIGTNIPITSSTESALDIEYIQAMDDEVALDFYIYPGEDFCSDLLDWTAALGNATTPGYVHSVSYGAQYYDPICPTGVRNRLDQDIMALGTQGITVTFASGDSGSGYFSRAGYNDGYLVPSWPASSPYVTAVGATTFGDFGSNDKVEVAVTEFGSGGGFSWNHALPSWQSSTVNNFFSSYPSSSLPPSGSYTTNGRGTPDVAALGQNYVVVVDGEKEPGVGGTSCASPVFAGILTRINDELLNNGMSTLGWINQVLYSGSAASAFYDVTSGSDKIGADIEGWDCTPGWDPVSGFGTPNYPALLNVFMDLQARKKQ